MDAAVFKIQVRCQSAQLGNAEAGPQQNDDLITILPVDRIASGKSKKAVLLLLGPCDLFLRVILQDGIHGKVKRVLSDTVILYRTVETRFRKQSQPAFRFPHRPSPRADGSGSGHFLQYSCVLPHGNLRPTAADRKRSALRLSFPSIPKHK